MTFRYLQTFFAAHPISFRSMGASFLSFFLLSALLFSVAIQGVYEKDIIEVINENRAPKTFEFLCSVALLFLSFHVARIGPIADLNTRWVHILGVYFPNVALGIGGAYVGTTCGVALAALVFDLPLPAPYTPSSIISLSIVYIVGLLLIYSFFVLITVNESVAPGYRTLRFSKVMRILAGVFCFLLVGRTTVLLLILLTNGRGAVP
ncbi:MAG: hypothetical protein PHC94_01055 [Methylobacter sp.]|nr:hypothetical protein [Methylobacter sp.]